MTCDRPFHDQIPALLQAMDAGGRLTAVTDRWLDWLGYERSHVIGRPWQEFLTTTARLQLADWTELDWVSDSPVDQVLPFRTAQGEAVEAEVAVSLLHDEAGLPTTYLVSLRESLSGHQSAFSQATQAALPVCEQWFELITETMQDVFWIHDVQTRQAIYNSPSFEAVWGLKPEDLQPDLQNLIERIHPDDREAFVASVRKQYTQTAQFDNTFRICLPSGEVRWLQERYFPLLDEQGRPARLVGMTSDITDQQRAWLAVAQSEERFQLLVQNLQDVFWLTDIQTGKNLYVNSAVETLWQLPQSAFYEDPFVFLQRVHPDDRARVTTTVQTCLAEARDVDLEYRLQLPDGTIRWIRDRGFMILDDMGTTTQMAGIATDITARKQDESHLQQYERTIAASPDALCLIGRDYRYRLSNVAYHQWFHLEANVCGKHLVDCFGEDFFNTISKPRCDQALAGNTQYFEEWLYTPQQDQAKFISITYAPYYEADGQIGGVINCIRDLTTLKHTRDRLDQMANRLQLHIHNSPLAVIEWTPAQQVDNWSSQAAIFFGWLESDMVRRHVSELPIFPDDVKPQLTDYIRELLHRPDQQQTVITRNVHRDGSELFCEWHNSVLRDAAGEVVSILSFVQDITERRQAQLALQASEERWQLAITGSNEGIWDWQISTDEVFYSPRWKEQLGYADDELENSREVWTSRVHPDDLARVQTTMQAHLQGQSLTYQSEYRLRHRSGNYRWILSRGQAIFNEAGQPMRFVGSHVDITDRKQAELDLQASQKLLQMVFDHLPQRVFWKALDGRFLGCNQSFAVDMGCKFPSAVIGKSDADLQVLSPESLQLFQARDRDVAAGQIIVVEDQVQHYLDGQTRWVSTTKAPFRTPQGELRGIFGCYEDVTERVLAQRSLQRYARMVEAAQDGICLTDTHYRYQVTNQTYHDWYSTADRPILGQTIAEVLGAVDFEQRLKPLHDQCLQGETIHYECWFDFPQVGRRFRSVTMTPYREENSDITGIVTSIRDLTDLKDSEDQQQQLLEIIEATPDLVGTSSPDGQVFYLNPAFENFVAENLHSPEATAHIRNYHPQWAALKVMNEAIPAAISEGTWQGETALCGADGAEIPVLQTITAHRDEQGNVKMLSTIAHDHRPQKRLEQELRDRLEFERLLSHLSTEFVNLPSADLLAAMTQALQRIAAAIGVQRSYVYLLSADLQQSELYSQWHEVALAPLPAEWGAVPVEDFTWWISQLRQRQVITLDDAAQMPAEAENERLVMAAFGMRSLALVPMHHSQHLIGYVGFAATLIKAWTEHEIALLQIVGDLFANAYQRQRVEAALRQQEHYYRSLTENASDLVMLLDHRGRVQYVTPSITRLLNYRPDEVQNRSVMRLTIPADWPSLATLWEAILHHPGMPQPVVQCRVKHKTAAQWRYFEVIATSLLDDPVIQGVVVNCRDVSDRVAAEAAQRLSEQVFQAIFEQSAVGMAQLSLDGTYIKVNPAFCQLVGYHADELIGEHFAKITHPEDLGYDRRMSAAVARGDVPSQTIDIRFVCADHSVRHVQVVMTAVQSDQGRPAFWTSVYNDMTEQLLAERSLRNIVEGTASVTGAAFFLVLAERLADTLEIDHVLINQLNDDATLTNLVFWSQEQEQETLTYGLSNTPCELTLRQGFYCCPQAVQATFPNDIDLQVLNAESYVGAALRDSQGTLIGEICAIHSQAIHHVDNAATLLRIFAARASAELDRQRADVALKATEANWRKILEHMPVLLESVQENGLITLWNQECERVTGYRADEIVGNPEALNLLYPDPDYRQVMLTRWQQRGNNYRNWEWAFTCKDGSQRIIAWSNVSDKFPIPDLGAWGVGVDVTERRRAEDEVRRLNQVLEDHNQKLEELVELQTAELVTFMNSLPDQIFVVDRLQNITFGNQVVAEFAQLACPQELESKSIHNLFPENQATIYAQQNQQVFQTGEVLHMEEAIQTAEGQVFLDTYKIPLKRPDGEVYALIGTSRDITELVETRQALEHQAAQLAATNQELQSFSYSVSHDLRAPLRHINGFIAALKQRLDLTMPDSDAKVAHYIDVIDKSSQKMASLIDGLLTLSRVGRREMSRRPVPLRPLVDQALEVLTAVPNTPAAQLQITVDDLPTVYGDAALLQQVLSNLIGNAVKFSRDRTPAIIHIGQQADGTYFVRDNGVGFDMTYADKLFSPFQRLHKPDEFQGTGIGLAIVNRIIHRHHGQIWAESEPNRGTTIYFSLPLEPVASSTQEDSQD